jgi:hypothetical protein
MEGEPYTPDYLPFKSPLLGKLVGIYSSTDMHKSSHFLSAVARNYKCTLTLTRKLITTSCEIDPLS